MENSIILEMKGVRKSFGTVVALDDVSLQLNRREIHGLLGGNGAGKTTLMNILYGLYKPDAGEIYLHGERVEIQSPRDAIRLGIGMVHQHFLQIESYTVAENIVLGTPLKNWPTLNLAEQEKRITSLSERFGLEVDPRSLVEELPMGVRQKIEILKALYRGVEILILDEPTRGIDVGTKAAVHELMSRLAAQGMAILMISSELPEILGMSDRILVMYEGRVTGEFARSEASQEKIMMAATGQMKGGN
jgi:simple sugar transport system ATP-binding protein